MPQRPGRECRHGIRAGLNRHQVRARVTQRSELAAVAVTPQLAAQPGRIDACRADARADEDVGDRVPITEREYLLAIVISEQPQRRRTPWPGPQHSSRVTALPWPKALGPGPPGHVPPPTPSPPTHSPPPKQPSTTS